MSSDARDMYIYGTAEIRRITMYMDECKSIARTREVLSDKYLMEHIEENKFDNSKIMDFEELARELGV